jgi:hypothetical protein
MLPTQRMRLINRLTGDDLKRHTLAQQLVGAHVGLIESDAKSTRGAAE